MTSALLRSPEPIAGYALRERIGAGGYGEVWKADAPGGLVKAVKFVFGCLDEQRAACEMKALNRIKEVRHPFLLSLERIEVVDGQLLIVTELADQSLKDRFEECKKQALPGIPRAELLVYLRDAADALDYMSEHYSLQHLDVKPENLLVVGGRVKVADFGLVKDIHDATVSLMGGLTPVYASPEVYEGRPSLSSDQYSLAIVYQEMLTGVLPFPGRTPAQLAAQHLNARPRLGSLTDEDRPIVARALAKDPADRFPSCRALIESLLHPGEPVGEDGRRTARAAGKKEEESDTTSVQGQVTQTFAIDALCGPAAAVPAPRAAATADAAPASPAADLGPLDVRPQDARFRPTLFVGVGGLAGRALRQLRGRLHDRFGRADALPALRTLLLDTDVRACAQLTQGDETTALPHRDALAVPLRPPHEYRGDSGKLLGWLSRRWLYNIPRSLQTEGIRPLGRLALADHATAVVGKLRETLREIAAGPAVAASAKTAGMTPADGPPQVFIVASICGGAGGGMALDLGYAVRDLLAETASDGSATAVYGVLVYGAGRGPNEKQVAAANAYAALAELDHYAQAGYPGDPALGLAAFPPRTAPFDETYLVHLGDDLDGADFDAGADQLAEYLFLGAATSAAAFFERCRAAEQAKVRSTGRLELRTFGLRQVGSRQSGVAGPAGQLVCKTVIEQWLDPEKGDRSNLPRSGPEGASHKLDLSPFSAAPSAAPPGETDEDLEQHAARMGIGRDAFVEIAREVVAVQLGCEADEFLRRAFDEVVGPREDDPAAQGTPWAAALLAKVHEALGVGGAEDDPGAPAKDSVRAAIEAPVRRLAAPRAEAACAWLLKRVDDRGAGLPRARHAAGWFAARLRAVEAEFAAASQQIQNALVALRRSLLDAKSSDRAQLRAWLSLGRGRQQGPKLDERWMEYGRLRVEEVVLCAAMLLARAVRAQIALAGDRLADLHRELSHLAGQFEVPAGWGQPKRELGLAPADEAVQQIAAALRQAVPAMAGELDEQLRQSLLAPHGGLMGLLEHSAALRPRLLRSLRAEARTAVAKALNEIRVAGALGGRDEADDRPFAECFEKSRPRLLDCGGARRLLVLCPADALETARRETAESGLRPAPTVLPDPCGSLLMCHEVSGMSLGRAAAEIIEDRRDLAEMASRLHTRVDVTWRRLGRQ